MNWVLLSPFTKSKNPGWIFDYINKDQHTVNAAPACYEHDRSRAYCSRKEWLDYARHAWSGYSSILFATKPIGIITVFPQLTAVAALLKQLLMGGRRVKLLAWCFNMGKPYQGYKGKLARAVLSSVNIFVVHSRAEIDIYSQWLQLPAERFIYVPLSAEVPALAHSKAALKETEPYVVALGTANRDYKTLFQALRTLGYPAIVVCGPHAIAGIEVPENVEVRAGLTLDACHALALGARVNVIPIQDTQAASGQVTLIESMMLGTALVVTRCAGTVDYVSEDVDALMVEPHDTQGMVIAIKLLWEDAGLRKKLSAQAQAAALASYTFEAVGSQLQNALDKVAAE